MILKRKIYEHLLKWKNECQGSKAILVEGARRTGKSTIVEEFAKREYESYILIHAPEVKELPFVPPLSYPRQQHQANAA